MDKGNNKDIGKISEQNILEQEDDIMATSSFSKSFTLESKKAVNSFTKMITNPAKSVKINRSLTSPEKEREGELRLKRILYR